MAQSSLTVKVSKDELISKLEARQKTIKAEFDERMAEFTAARKAILPLVQAAFKEAIKDPKNFGFGYGAAGSVSLSVKSDEFKVPAKPSLSHDYQAIERQILQLRMSVDDLITVNSRNDFFKYL
jgi:hypothetical protein